MLQLHKIDVASRAQNNLGRVINSVRVKELEGYSFAATRWSDGTEFDFPMMFLRDNCQCSTCFDYSSGQRKVMIDAIEDDVKGRPSILSGGLALDWKDGHQSAFSAEWLSQRLPTGTASYDNLRETVWEGWSADDMQKLLPRHDYSEVYHPMRCPVQAMECPVLT